MNVRYRPSALTAIARYDLFRQGRGYQPIGDEILDAVEKSLRAATGWDGIPGPAARVRGEVLPVKRLLVRVRSKTFKANIRQGPTPDVVVVAYVRHPGQQMIER